MNDWIPVGTPQWKQDGVKMVLVILEVNQKTGKYRYKEYVNE